MNLDNFDQNLGKWQKFQIFHFEKVRFLDPKSRTDYYSSVVAGNIRQHSIINERNSFYSNDASYLKKFGCRLSKFSSTLVAKSRIRTCLDSAMVTNTR